VPILTNPNTGGRFPVDTEAQVRFWARSGWVVDEDQSPIDAPAPPEPVAPAEPEPVPASSDPEPAATATRTSKKEK